jgi:hypothetical protein
MPKPITRRARPLLTALLAPASLACATQLGVAYPLCDERGAPACGNIGQVGRPQPPAPAARGAAALLPLPVTREGVPLLALGSAAVGITAAVATAVWIGWPRDEEPARDVAIVPQPPPPTPPPPNDPPPEHPDEDDDDDDDARDALLSRATGTADECENRPLLDEQCRPACDNVIVEGKGRARCIRARR